MNSLESINLNLLIFFHWMLLEKNVSNAAKRVGLTQPAASRRLKQLREIFKDELFVRHGRNLIPTQKSLLIEPKLADAITNLRNVMCLPDSFDPEIFDRQFSFASNDYLGTIASKFWEQSIATTAKHAKVNWRPLDSMTIRNMISGNIDIVLLPYQALDNLPDAAVLQDMVTRPFFTDHYVIFGRDDHPLFLQKKITLNDFVSTEQILVSPSGSGPGIIDIELDKLNHTRNISCRTWSFLLAAQTALHSDCITVLPERFAKALAYGTFINLPFDSPEIPCLIVWHVSRNKDAEHKWFRDQLIQATNTLHHQSS